MEDFVNILVKWRRKLGDNILRNYTKIKYLHATSNPKITNVNHLTNLRTLYANEHCGIDNAGIANLNLQELYVWCNEKITDINHMTT